MAGSLSFIQWLRQTHPDSVNHEHDYATAHPETKQAYVDYMNAQGGNYSITSDGRIDDGGPKTDWGTDAIKLGTTIAGGVVGGPLGAAAVGGAWKAYDAAGAAQDEAAHQQALADQRKNGTGAGGGAVGSTTPNAAAWAPTPSAGYGGTGYESDQTKALKARMAQLQGQQYTTVTIQTPAGPMQQQVPIQNPEMDKEYAALKAQLATSQARDSSVSDTNRLAREADTVSSRAAPNIRPTTIDFSGARPYEQRQLSAGDLQRQQADALMAGTSGAGQQALIDRLNSDLEGNAPSLAQLQLEEGRDAAMRNALSIANSARGPTQGLTQIEALRANQAAMQDATRQAMLLRAQEYASARDALGGVLNQQRTGGIQEQNIAATELGQTRTQDLQALADKYNNAVQQGQLTDADARAQLDAELRQRGMNDQQVQFYTQQYFGQQNRAQDTAIDAEKTRINAALGLGAQDLTKRGQDIQQGQYDTNRTDKYVAAGLQGAATLGQGLNQSGTSSGPGVQSSPGTGASTTTTTPKDTGYGYGTDTDPDKLLDDSEAA